MSLFRNTLLPRTNVHNQPHHQSHSQMMFHRNARQYKGTPSIIFAVERTYAAWAKMSIWVFTIGMLAMNANQMIAAADLSVRIQSPIFVIGFIFALAGLVSIPYHLYTYEQRMQLFTNSENLSNRRGIYMTSWLLFLVMLSALLGSAFYGATEVVQVA